MTKNNNQFLRSAGRIINSGQSRSLILYGNVHDLFSFRSGDTEDYVNLTALLDQSWTLPGYVVVHYEPNGLIRIPDEHLEPLSEAWDALRGVDSRDDRAIKVMLGHQVDPSPPSLQERIRSAIGDSLKALEILRQLTIASRKGHYENRLIIIVESADIILPEGTVASLSERDRYRVSLVQEWFSDPAFAEASDSLILIAEAKSQINHRITQLPQTLAIEVDAPDRDQRLAFISWFQQNQHEQNLSLDMSSEELASLTAGLSLYALRQLLMGAVYSETSICHEDVIKKVEDYIIDQIGSGVIEFKKPSQSMADVVGASKLKEFLTTQFIPRLRSSGPDALTGAAIAGPIGSGKSYIFEAVAGELGIVVLTIKNIRSQWFGQTDVLFEKLRRVLMSIGRALIFVDEADTQFGRIGANEHATERRLTGKMQELMSDPRMKGKLTWLLITARIHLLSPDIRRPGRTGSLIIPVLDPQGDDHRAFVRWTVEKFLQEPMTDEILDSLSEVMRDYSAAMFAGIRSELSAQPQTLSHEEILAIIEDLIPPAIEETRRYQALQALVNCTRKSLLPEDIEYSPEKRLEWSTEIKRLESLGIS
ncbi:MAG: ATP-binding protein [Verrucomicrobiota bacterium]